MSEPTDENRSGSRREPEQDGAGGLVADRTGDEPEPKDRLTWALVWGMGIVGVIVVIVWLGMILFIH